ncbi:hypothetical protein PHLCEN_2v4463 [Hermanssonia centrifuga]|uniref:Uncharacterized protein n=1 Tax=Hermanssonia centrifuga TaxID=98765 RepID=A0A2R6PNG4_9APHY|nr:hypothetical protein PHLCEN_2v4463 [Hermanssonia centrifuga]
MSNALLQLFKLTPQDLALRLQSYLTSGLMGAVQATKGKRSTELIKELRSRIPELLLHVLREEKRVPEKDLPKTMKWAYYEDLCCEFGVELIGWTEPGELCNPADMKTPALQRVLNAIKSGHCYWQVLSEDDWTTKKTARAEVIAREGTSRSRKNKPKSKKTTKSPETINDLDGGEGTSESTEAGARRDGGSEPEMGPVGNHA